MSTGALVQPAADGRRGSVAEGRARRLAFLPSVIISPLLSALAAFVWFAIRTWPVPIRPGSWMVTGPGDGWGGTAVVGATVREGLNPFAPGTIRAFNAPDGFPVSWQVNLQSWWSTVVQYSATKVFGEVAAVNLYIVLGILLTAGVTAWVVEHLVADRWIAALCGFALATCPLLAVKAGGHNSFVHLWPFPLILGTLIRAHERPTLKRGALAGLAAFVGASVSGYHLLIVVVLFGTLISGLGVLALWRADRRRQLVALAAAGVAFAGGMVVVVALLFILGSGTANPDSIVRSNPREALFVSGARWYASLVPPASAALFSGETADFFKTRIHGSNPLETTLYVGLSVLALALAGVIGVVRDARLRASRGMAALVVVMVVVAGAFSLPPQVSPLGFRIPAPSDIVFSFVTTWRVYSRFAVVVSLGLLVLAAFGLRSLAGVRARRRIAVLAIATLVIPLDLATRVTGEQTQVGYPAVLSRVRSLPPGIVADYPLSRGEVDGYGVLFNQRVTGHPVLNGFDDRPQEARAPQLSNLADLQTAGRLDALGVRYVLVVRRPVSPGEVDPGVPPPGTLKPISTGLYGPWSAEVYEVPRRPGSVVATTTSGFGAVEGTGPDAAQWLEQPTGTIDLRGDCPTACQGTLRFRAVAFGPPRSVAVRVGGTIVKTVRVGADRGVAVHLSLGRRTTVELVPTPGPIAASKLQPGTADERSLAIQVRRVSYTPDSR
ncbi:MAG: hypothetical protein NVS3B18_09620 [Candidatus Dormibacteria bacterium]